MSNIGINCNLILDRNIELLQHPHEYCFLQHPHDYCFLQHPHGYCFFCSCRFLLSFVFILLLLWLFLLFVWLTCLLWVVIVGFLHKFYIPCQTPPWLRRYNLCGHLVNHYTETMRYWLGRWVTKGWVRLWLLWSRLN